MKFFIDTAEIKEIREAAAMGLVDGVTTNPSLVAKTGRKFRDVLLEICDIVKGPVSAEVVSDQLRRHDARGARVRGAPQQHRRQDPADRRGPQGGPDVHRRGHQDQRHAVLLGDPGAARGQGRRDVHLAVRRPPRRHLDRRHAADRRDRRRSTTTTTSTTEVLVASVRTRCTCSRRRCMGAHVATCPLSVLLAARASTRSPTSASPSSSRTGRRSRSDPAAGPRRRLARTTGGPRT